MKVKPAGMDELDVRLLKLVSDVISIPVFHIIISLLKCRCPVKWKVAKIVPLPKNGKESFSGKNSRPVSILPILSKIMEKIAYDQINLYFCKNGLNSSSQHAYKNGHSTTTALAQNTDDWMNYIEDKKLVGTVLLDMSAAFDLLDHDLLLEKLRAYGFQNSAIQWVKSYLSNREFTVFFNGSYSESRSLSCGVPQGSCLGPLLFSIFTNELPLILENATIVLYADDLTIYVSDHNLMNLNTRLNEELKVIEDWINENRLVINAKKTKCLIGSPHLLKDSPVLNVSIGGSVIEQVVEAKLLGVKVDNMLSWNNQITYILNKFGKSLAMVRCCSKCIPYSVRKILVESIVLCHLDYCSIIWSATTESNFNKLQVAQNKAARLVLSCSFRTSIEEMHHRLAWLHVKRRVHYSLIKFIRKIMITKAPEILYNKVTFFRDVHQYSTCQADEGSFFLPACRTNQSQKTVRYRAMVAWNSLPQFLNLQLYVTTFCKRLRLFLLTQE
uniref:Reverse transcriptase domain-containing protein n=1 Tax=Amphiprion ocellaris TaxID=80972 RepID=A0AAQ5ZG27_AMPOC